MRRAATYLSPRHAGGVRAALVSIAMIYAFPSFAQTTGTCQPGQAAADLDIGNVRARVFSTGGFFSNGGAPVYEVPKGSGVNAIYSSGIWIGGLVDGELRLAATTSGYSYEFWPGPLDENGTPPADCSAYDHIYVVDRYDLESLDTTGKATDDILEWPWALGAPIADGDGNPNNYDLAAGDRPEILGDQIAWWIFNDAGNEHGWLHTPPIGIEVQASAVAFERDDVIGNTTFYRFRLVYRGAATFDSVYFGIYADADVGNRRDDYIGSDSLRGMGFFYNADDFDEGDRGYGFPPPAVGFDVLAGALADADGIDNNFNGVVDEQGERLQLTSMLQEANWYYQQGQFRYNQLQGKWQDGRTMTYGGTGVGWSQTPTTWLYSGNPPEFWTEDRPWPGGTPNVPSDRDMIMSSGPFSMNPGDIQDIWLAIVWSRGSDRLDSVRRLKEDAALVQTFFDEGMTAPQQPPPSASPVLVAPADGALGQPTNPTLRWKLIHGINRYEWEIDDDFDFNSPLLSDTANVAEVNVDNPLPSDAHFYWRVRAVNFAGAGPWSDARSFTTGAGTMTIGQSGLLVIEGSIMFVEVAGPDDRYACGPLAESRFGCDEVGGNFIYPSFNGSGEYIMYLEGPGPEDVIGNFAPRDYEIRFTETGSHGYHPFTTGNAIWVPFEVWDIGPTYTGTNVNPNDPADDVQMIPILFVGSRSTECTWFYDPAVPGAFGVFPGSTQRVYAYYPTTTYADWEAAVKPLVDTDPNNCPNAHDATGGAIEGHIDFGRGRPLQRIVYFGDGALDPPHPAFGVVNRFYTKDPVPPSAPITSAPLDGATGLEVPITLAWNSVSQQHAVQVAADADFESLVLDTTTNATFYRIDRLPAPGTYYWRINATANWPNEPRTSDWSAVASFSASVVVGTEDDTGLPDRFTLEPNYPNPFNPVTTIRFALPSAERVTLDVYDVVGRRVARLIDARLPAGLHEVRWNANRFASGMYLYRIRAGTFQQSRAMILLR